MELCGGRLFSTVEKNVRNSWKYSNEDKRVPQNLMSTSPATQVKDKVLYYTMEPIPEGNDGVCEN